MKHLTYPVMKRCMFGLQVLGSTLDRLLNFGNCCKPTIRIDLVKVQGITRVKNVIVNGIIFMRLPYSIAYLWTIRVDIPFQVCVPHPNDVVGILRIILEIGFGASSAAQAHMHICANSDPANSGARNDFPRNQTRVSKVFIKIVFHLQACLKVVRPPIWGLNFKTHSLLHFIKVRW